MRYAHGHPLDSKEAMAEWMRYPSVEAMDNDHDDLHEALAGFFAVPSHSLRIRDGEELTENEKHLAAVEETAVLHVQRWLQWLRVEENDKGSVRGD